MNQLIADFLSGKLRGINRLLMILCFASGLFTYRGGALMAQDFDDKAGASVFALASGCAIYLFWHVALKAVPNLKTLQEKTLGLAVVLTGCGFIIPLSSALNVAGLAGSDALETHAQRSIAGFEEIVAARYAHGRKIEGIVPDLKQEAARLQAAAQDEFQNGAYTGNSGTGAVEGSLNAMAARLDGLREDVEEHLAKSRTLAEAANGELAFMRRIVVSDKPLIIRMRDLSKRADRLRTVLSEMNGRGLAESAGRLLTALPREVDLRIRYSANPATERRQRNALARVREDIIQTTAIIAQFIARISELPTEDIASIERISPVRAVITYWPDYVSYWAGGIALDIAPLAVMLFLMIAISAKTDTEIAQARLMAMTVEDLIRANLDQDAIRRMGLDQDSAQEMNDNLLGKDKHKSKTKG